MAVLFGVVRRAEHERSGKRGTAGQREGDRRRRRAMEQAMAAGSAAIPGGYAANAGNAQRWRILGASCFLAVALGTSPTIVALLTPTTPDVFGYTSLTVQLTVNVV